jgi:hypothetical protein
MKNFEEKLNISEILKKITDNSPARELNINERVLIKNHTSHLLREAVVYANVSDNVPTDESSESNTNSHYCVKLTHPSESERLMAYENYVKRSDLLITTGCGDKFCVGQEIIESKTHDLFTIIGIDINGDYAISSSANRIMLGLQDKDLIKK